jgi:hypothetical protein
LDCVKKKVADVAYLIHEDDSAQVKTQKEALLKARIKKDKKCKSMIIQRIADSHLEYVKEKETPKQIKIFLPPFSNQKEYPVNYIFVKSV